MIPGWQMEAYERLRTEIVRSAVKDLRAAMRKSDRIGHVCDEQTNLEAWFLSKWGQFLCENRGKYIVERCRETYKGSKPKQSKQRIPDDIQRKICEDYKNGLRYRHLLQRYGISSATLYGILRRWGV